MTKALNKPKKFALLERFVYFDHLFILKVIRRPNGY
ncbi:hypothetical protein ATW7_10528 [Alteromonadales bacterium TW-7]|nr:hypothetical protein ATW7_10528 [Alteromonadales bacterium TW-7]